MYNYDYEKAKQIIEANKNQIVSASLGMAQDWYWTAVTVYEDNEYKIDLTQPELVIAGINGSYWATPILKLEFENYMYKDYDCYYMESEHE